MITFSMLLSQLKASDNFVLSVNKWDSLCFTGGRGEGTNFYWLSLLLCVFIIAKVFVVLFVVVFVARAGALIRSSLWISTWIVRGHPFREFESTHNNVCKGSLQKTRGEVRKVSKKRWRCIAVLLKLDSPIFYTFLWWALHKTIRSNGPRSALNTEEPNRETRNDAFFTFNLCCQWTQKN